LYHIEKTTLYIIYIEHYFDFVYDHT